MLSLSDIVRLKSELKETYGAGLHYHDVCPRPYFTLDSENEEIRRYLTEFLSSLRLRPSFSDDGLQFTVEKI